MRPKVHRSELARAIARIAGRRTKVDDRNRYLLPDSPDSDPREILDYLLKFSGADIPRWVLQADVSDALMLNNWLWWEDRRRELQFLRAGRDRGLYLAQIGAQVGVGKQGVLDRIDRLTALLQYDRPDEKLTRAARRSHHAVQERRTAELAWLSNRHDELISVMRATIDFADRCAIDDDGREWIDQLAMDVREDELTRGTMVILGLATSELRSACVSQDTDGVPSDLAKVLVRADMLRSAFAGIGRESYRS